MKDEKNIVAAVDIGTSKILAVVAEIKGKISVIDSHFTI